MAEKQSSLSESVIQQLRKTLSDASYKHCFHLLSEMHCRLVSPNIFRAKMEFLFKHHRGLLRTLNPLLPDEYQFSEKELQEKARDYKELEKLEPSIEFVNELISRVDSSADLRKFYHLVKSYKGKKMVESEFYGLAYKYLRGEFHIMRKLGKVLKYDTTPSYIEKPRMIPRASKENYSVLNRRFSIYSEKASESIQIDEAEFYYIYEPDRVIKMSAKKPSMNKRMSLKERKLEEVMWWESRRSELDLVLGMLTVAEEEVGLAFMRMRSGKWVVNEELREYLVSKGVKLKLLERMNFGKMEELAVERLPDVVNLLKQKKLEVEEAIRKLNLKHK